MCGIAGLFTRNWNENTINDILKFKTFIASRGPDSNGEYFDEGSIGMVHTRLSIVDLSDSGHQPMQSLCNRFAIVYNGEIYNARYLYNYLIDKGYNITLKGTSDTEILLNSIAAIGLNQTLLIARGMFSFALWDIQKKELILARDRTGQKPLYFSTISGEVLFSSQLGPFIMKYGIRNNINRQALLDYLRLGYTPDQLSILNNVRKLKPGTYITFVSSSSEGVITEYWSLRSSIPRLKNSKLILETKSYQDDLELKLKRKIREQLSADVPVGVLLSGGLDSSVITSLARELDPSINSFSIGIKDSMFDEGIYSRSVAKELDVKHNELYISAEDALDVINLLPDIWDEPFADSSQIPMVILSRFCINSVKVVLSGDGGDEIFCGYNRYLTGYQIFRFTKFLPIILKQYITSFQENLSVSYLQNLLDRLGKSQLHLIGQGRLNKMLTAASCINLDQYYNSIIENQSFKKDLLLGSFSLTDKYIRLSEDNNLDSLNDVEKLMLADFEGYLTSDILTKVDRSSMHYALESRCPFLDRDIVEYAWSVNHKFKASFNKGKLLLRSILSSRLPKHLIDRPKLGFAIPISSWLRNDLNDYMRQLLATDILSSQGLFDVAYVDALVEEHSVGIKDHSSILWNLLIFQQWYYKYTNY